MDTMNSAMHVLSNFRETRHTSLEVLQPLPEEVQQAWKTLLTDALSNQYSPVQDQNGYIYARISETQEQGQETALIPLDKLISNMIDETRKWFMLEDIKPIADSVLQQFDMPQIKVYRQTTESLDGNLIIQYESSQQHAIELSSEGYFREIHQAELDTDTYLLPASHSIPILQCEKSREKVEHYFKNSDSNDFRIFDQFAGMVQDSGFFVEDLEVMNRQIIPMSLAYMLMPRPDSEPVPKLYFGSEFSSHPEQILTRHRIRQLRRFAPVEILERKLSNPRESQIMEVVVLPLLSGDQENIIDNLEVIKEKEHELMAKLLQLACQVHKQKKTMGQVEYEALIPDEGYHQLPLIDFYRFIMLAAPIVWCNEEYATAGLLMTHIFSQIGPDQYAAHMIHQIDGIQEKLIERYKPFDVLGDAISQRMMDPEGLTDDDTLHRANKAWQGQPDTMLEELDALISESNRPDYWPNSGDELVALTKEMDDFLRTNYYIVSSTDTSNDNEPAMLIYQELK